MLSLLGLSTLAALLVSSGGGGLISLLITVAIVGVIVYVITAFLPMPPVFKNIIWVIAALIVLFMLLNVLGVFSNGAIVAG